MSLFVAIWLMGAVAQAQNYRGEAVPVVQRVDPVELTRVRLLTFAFGHEGPMDTPLPTPPVAGREYFFEADVFGIESVATIRFELLNTAGTPLQTITTWRESDASDEGEFHGFVRVPSQPFRFSVSGSNTNRATFRFVLNTLFQPAPTGPVEQPILPPGLSAADRTQLQNFVTGYRQELQARSAQAATDHPGGVITIARAAVSRISYEPLNSGSGSPIGLRLRYSIRFPARQTINAMPHAFPAYATPTWRGVVTMKVMGGTISPLPQTVAAQSMQDVILYGAPATYQAGSTYNFTIDLVPDYVIQGAQSGRFCIYEQKFINRAPWDALIASTADMPYTISISDTDTAATIPAFFAQRTFYRNFASDGAADCGPVPTNRF